MAVSIKMYRVTQYPVNFPIVTADVNPGFSSAMFKTAVEVLGRSEYTDELTKLQVTHDIGNEFKGKGWIEDGSNVDLVAISDVQRFPCFAQGTQYLYTSGTTRVISEQALKRLRRYPEDTQNCLVAEPVKINLINFKEYILTHGEAAVKGGWFRGMQIANVEVAYLGGGTVAESSDWERYEASGGTISAIRIDLPTLDPEEEKIKLLFTKDGNCVLYKNDTGELDLLRITLPIFESAKDFIEA